MGLGYMHLPWYDIGKYKLYLCDVGLLHDNEVCILALYSLTSVLYQVQLLQNRHAVMLKQLTMKTG